MYASNPVQFLNTNVGEIARVIFLVCCGHCENIHSVGPKDICHVTAQKQHVMLLVLDLQ